MSWELNMYRRNHCNYNKERFSQCFSCGNFLLHHRKNFFIIKNPHINQIHIDSTAEIGMIFTTSLLGKNVSGRCSAMPHMSQGCRLCRSGSPQFVRSMRRRQWRRTHYTPSPYMLLDREFGRSVDERHNESSTFCEMSKSVFSGS